MELLAPGLKNSYIFSKNLSLILQEGTRKPQALKKFLIFLFIYLFIYLFIFNKFIIFFLFFSKNKFIHLLFLIQIFPSEFFSSGSYEYSLSESTL